MRRLDDIPWYAALADRAAGAPAFFSIAETAMMAVNRYRLKHRAQRGARGARARAGAARPDRQAARRDPARQHARRRRGGDADGGDHRSACSAKASWRSRSARSRSRSCLLVFSEITPKVVGAAHADRIAPLVALRRWRRCCSSLRPIVWFVNLFVQGAAAAAPLAAAPANRSTTLTQEELRSLVLEGASTSAASTRRCSPTCWTSRRSASTT